MTKETKARHTSKARHTPLVAALSCMALAPAARAQCDPVWWPLGTGISYQEVNALAVYDDDTGEALYAAGDFQDAGGGRVNNIARWDGTIWSALDTGFTGSSDEVYALTVYDDGSGPALCAGGELAIAGGVWVQSVAKWDGSIWASVGNAIWGRTDALAVFDPGSGPQLYAGGRLLGTGPLTINGIASWNGTAWSSLGNGVLSQNASTAGEVRVLITHDDGSGPILIAANGFDTAGRVFAKAIAQWDGIEWAPLARGVESVANAVATFDDGSGPALFAAYTVSPHSNRDDFHLARWNGFFWTEVVDGLCGIATAMTVHDDGSGAALYVAGRFQVPGRPGDVYLGRFDGSSWSWVEDGPNDQILALTQFDDGSGTALYAAGRFPQAGGVFATRIAKWGRPVPQITRQPKAISITRPDQSITLTVEVANVANPVTVQWRKNGQPINDTPPLITGTATPSLNISPAIRSDAGRYDAILTNTCGEVLSKSAKVQVGCYADCDTSTGAFSLDLFDFLCFQGAFIRLDPYADCDEDNVLTLFDFLCFQDAFLGGCP